MEEKEKYQNTLNRCKKYIEETNEYCQQIKMKYDCVQPIIRRKNKNQLSPDNDDEKHSSNELQNQPKLSTRRKSNNNGNSIIQSTRKPKATTKTSEKRDDNKDYLAISSSKFNNTLKPVNKGSMNSQPMVPTKPSSVRRQKREISPETSIIPSWEDDARFIGKFDKVSNCDVGNYPKCAKCKKTYEGDFEIIACPDCLHWMHVECFVEHVIDQRKNNKRLSCPTCQKFYF